MVAFAGKSRQGARLRAAVILIALCAFAVGAARAQEPDPVQITLDEFQIRYPLDEPPRRKYVPPDQDEADPGYEPTSEEVETYAAWLEMLCRRASRAAANRPERNWAGHAREELRKGRKWLEVGHDEERIRGGHPPRRHPISIARHIDNQRIDKDPKHVSAYRKALHVMHRGARYALAVFEARGLDPEREPVEEEPKRKKKVKIGD
jgi:hypothetical protein